MTKSTYASSIKASEATQLKEKLFNTTSKKKRESDTKLPLLPGASKGLGLGSFALTASKNTQTQFDSNDSLYNDEFNQSRNSRYAGSNSNFIFEMDSNEYGFKHNFKNSSDFAQKKVCKVYNQRDYNYYNNTDYANIFWLKPEDGGSKT